jgi:hypothetical protein
VDLVYNAAKPVFQKDIDNLSCSADTPVSVFDF